MIILSNEYPSNIPGASRASRGGPARFARDLSSSLVANGHTWVGIQRVGVKTGPPKARFLGTNKKRRFWEAKISYEAYKKITNAKSVKSPVKILRKEIDIIRFIMQEEKPDLLFLNGFALHAWVLLRAAYEEGIPVVMQHAGIWKKEIQIYKDYFSPAGRRLMYAMERNITDYGTQEIFLNNFSRKAYEALIGKVPKSHCHVIPLPMPISLCEIVKAPSKSAVKRIGIVARWDRIKNHPAFLAVARETQKQKLSWEFHSVTRIPETNKMLALKNEYRKRIIVHGLMKTPQLAQFYRNMDLMLLPSKFDVSPHVILEAACQGTGTILSKNVGWVDEYQKTKNRIWIADFDKPKDVIKKMQTLMGKKQNEAFFTYVNKTHDPIRVHKQYLNLFTKVAG